MVHPVLFCARLKTLSERTQKAVAPDITSGTVPLAMARASTKRPSKPGSRDATSPISPRWRPDELIESSQRSRTRGGHGRANAQRTARHLIDIGLGYLSLDRETDTLSGGESQRVKMVKHLSGSLVDVTYIFDEPSVGLHPRDVHQLNELLQKLRDKGNTVIVVEHDPDVIKSPTTSWMWARTPARAAARSSSKAPTPGCSRPIP